MHYLLFTTTKCPKCPAFKDYVAEHVDMEGRVLDETQEDFLSLLQQYGATMAPTMIILNDQDQEVFRTSETPELAAFLHEL